MPRIHVCSLSRVEETVRQTGARTLVTLIEAGLPVARPAAIAPDNHLHVGISDIVDRAGRLCPAARRRMSTNCCPSCAAGTAANRIVMHCYAGVSRSTAAAFIAACALAPERPEQAFCGAHPASLADGHAECAAGGARRQCPRPRRPDGRGDRGDRPWHRMFRRRAFCIGPRMNVPPAPPLPIEIGLTAAIVAVAGDEPMILVARAGLGGLRSRAAVGAVRSGRPSHLRDRAARLGRRTDRDAARLCRAALHVRRSRPARAGGRPRPAHRLGRLSGADPHRRRAELRLGRRLPAVVLFLPLGGLARAAPGDPRRGDHPAPQGMGGGGTAGRGRRAG